MSLGERLAFQQLHDDVGRVIVVEAPVDHTADVRVADGDADDDLPFETLKLAFVGFLFGIGERFEGVV